MSIQEGQLFRQLQEQVERLVLDMAAVVERLGVLEAATTGECPACAQRRSADAERQRRLRQRHATAANEISTSIGC